MSEFPMSGIIKVLLFCSVLFYSTCQVLATTVYNYLKGGKWFPWLHWIELQLKPNKKQMHKLIYKQVEQERGVLVDSNS